MAHKKITTELELKKYIQRKLGGGILAVEVTDDQLSDCITDAVNKFTTFAYEGYTEDVFILPLQKGVKKYILPENTLAVLGVHVGNYSMFTMPDKSVIQSDFIFQMIGYNPTGAMFNLDITQISSMMAKIETLTRFFKKVPNYSWNSFKKEVIFLEDIFSQGFPQVMFHLAFEYIPGEEDDIYNHIWVKKYAQTLALLQQGTNLGKYDAALVSGSKVEYNRMISDARVDIVTLEEELTKLYAGPLGIQAIWKVLLILYLKKHLLVTLCLQQMSFLK